MRNRSPLIYILLGALIGGAIGLGTLTALRQIRHRDAIGITEVSDARSNIAPKPITGPLYASPSTSDPPVRRVEASTPSTRQATTPSTTSSSEHAPAAEKKTPAQPYSQGPSETGSPEPPDLLAQRLSETERWLVETDGSRFTIQILGAIDAEILRKDLNTFREYVDIERVFVYRTVANQRPSFTVLLGTYGTRAEAFREIEELPEPIRLNRPYYRTVRGVRAEIARAGIGSPTAEASTVDWQGY